MRQQNLTVTLIIFCIGISLILSLFSLQIVNGALGKQLLTFALGFLLTGIIAFVCLVVDFLIRKAGMRTEEFEVCQQMLIENFLMPLMWFGILDR
jgi:uncharacterized membrane protein